MGDGKIKNITKVKLYVMLTLRLRRLDLVLLSDITCTSSPLSLFWWWLG